MLKNNIHTYPSAIKHSVPIDLKRDSEKFKTLKLQIHNSHNAFQWDMRKTNKTTSNNIQHNPTSRFCSIRSTVYSHANIKAFHKKTDKGEPDGGARGNVSGSSKVV